MNTKFSEQVLDLIRVAVDRCGSASALARATGVSNANLHRWTKQGILPHVEQLDAIFELIGATISIPDHMPAPSNPVQFVTPRIVPAGEGAPTPPSEDYLAIPVIDEIQAKHGPVSPIDIKAWFMVHKQSPKLRYRKDLVAIVKDREYNSQEPTIRGGDILIVDRELRQPEDGAYMVVLIKGRACVCRVAESDGGESLTCYSDDKRSFPKVLSIKRDLDGDARKAIIGKVLYTWCDMEGR